MFLVFMAIWAIPVIIFSPFLNDCNYYNIHSENDQIKFILKQPYPPVKKTVANGVKNITNVINVHFGLTFYFSPITLRLPTNKLYEVMYDKDNPG